MPRSFPNLKSLENNAAMRGFRTINKSETEDEYRIAFADFMKTVDIVESMEIRSGKGWDQLSPEELLFGALY